MMSILLAFVLMASFFVAEGWLREGPTAKNLERGEFDRGSSMLLGAAFGASVLVLLAAVALDYFQIGIGVMIAGLGLHIWATRVLGEFYTRTLLTTDHQAIVERGPYRLIRHPGYLGMIALWIGAGLAVANGIALVTLLMLAAYSYRIRSEEAMLVATFGEQYKKYVTRARRLIPFLY